MYIIYLSNLIVAHFKRCFFLSEILIVFNKYLSYNMFNASGRPTQQ